jgi:putative copper export protein
MYMLKYYVKVRVKYYVKVRVVHIVASSYNIYGILLLVILCIKDGNTVVSIYKRNTSKAFWVCRM